MMDQPPLSFTDRQPVLNQCQYNTSTVADSVGSTETSRPGGVSLKCMKNFPSTAATTALHHLLVLVADSATRPQSAPKASNSNPPYRLQVQIGIHKANDAAPNLPLGVAAIGNTADADFNTKAINKCSVYTARTFKWAVFTTKSVKKSQASTPRWEVFSFESVKESPADTVKWKVFSTKSVKRSPAVAVKWTIFSTGSVKESPAGRVK